MRSIAGAPSDIGFEAEQTALVAEIVKIELDGSTRPASDLDQADAPSEAALVGGWRSFSR